MPFVAWVTVVIAVLIIAAAALGLVRVILPPEWPSARPSPT